MEIVKNILIVVLLLVVIVVGAAVATIVILAKNADASITVEEPHYHELVAVNTIKEATCTENGEQEIVCKACEHKQTKELEALGHDYITITENDTTIVLKCKRCDDIIMTDKTTPAE